MPCSSAWLLAAVAPTVDSSATVYAVGDPQLLLLFYLESEQHADRLERVCAAVDIVTEEEVVYVPKRNSTDRESPVCWQYTDRRRTV